MGEGGGELDGFAHKFPFHLGGSLVLEGRTVRGSGRITDSNM